MLLYRVVLAQIYEQLSFGCELLDHTTNYLCKNYSVINFSCIAHCLKQINNILHDILLDYVLIDA